MAKLFRPCGNRCAAQEAFVGNNMGFYLWPQMAQQAEMPMGSNDRA